ncbi:hypothetical protein HK104_002969 [Borealophlyctis nickersoniae]|nr:hypothetical protein HK104_002969 [Borealophlyctis nickersoniae]
MVARRNPRACKKKNHTDDPQVPPPPTKRRKITQTLVDPTPSSVHPTPTLSTIPTDVLFDIFQYVSPIGTLRCSVTCKRLKTFVDALPERFWTARREEHMGDAYPAPPEGVTEKEYLALIFGRGCQATIGGNALYDDIGVDPRAVIGLPYITGKYCLNLPSLVAALNGTSNLGSSWYGRSYLLNQVLSAKREFRKARTELVRSQWIEDQRRMASVSESDVARMEDAEARRRTMRHRELQAKRDVRKSQIDLRIKGTPNLHSADWIHQSGAYHTAVRQPTPLTDRCWHNLLRKLQNELDERQQTIEESHRRAEQKKTRLAELRGLAGTASVLSLVGTHGVTTKELREYGKAWPCPQCGGPTLFTYGELRRHTWRKHEGNRGMRMASA